MSPTWSTSLSSGSGLAGKRHYSQDVSNLVHFFVLWLWTRPALALPFLYFAFPPFTSTSSSSTASFWAVGPDIIQYRFSALLSCHLLQPCITQGVLNKAQLFEFDAITQLSGHLRQPVRSQV